MGLSQPKFSRHAYESGGGYMTADEVEGVIGIPEQELVGRHWAARMRPLRSDR